MFISTGTPHFALQIPTVRNDFKVLAFSGLEAIRRQILEKPGIPPEQRLDELNTALTHQLLTHKEVCP